MMSLFPEFFKNIFAGKNCALLSIFSIVYDLKSPNYDTTLSKKQQKTVYTKNMLCVQAYI